MDIVHITNSICEYFSLLPDVKKCTISGSTAAQRHDEYSDIDIELDVSGRDNGRYALRIPELLNSIYPVIFFDYAPSLLPDRYIVSNAISYENPFLIVDIACVATPHHMTVSRSDLPYNVVDHTLKVFVANLKHMIRGADCVGDIRRMHARVCGSSGLLSSEGMMRSVFDWLGSNADARYHNYLESLRAYL